MPAILKEIGAKAIVRHEKRDATPEIEIGVEGGGWTFRSPYEDEDLAEWEALLFDAFATRSIAAFQSFATQLAELCSTDWHGDEKGWLPNSSELRAAIQVVRSLRPRDEAEACLAAQMVAVHLMQIKLSAQALKQSYPDPRTCAIAGKLGRTYAMQLETMAKLRGKVTRQRITVRKYSQHEHKHIHLHQGRLKMGTNPMDQESAKRLKQERLGNLRRAPRCLAQTQRGTPCQSPAIKGRKRCRLHGAQADRALRWAKLMGHLSMGVGHVKQLSSAVRGQGFSGICDDSGVRADYRSRRAPESGSALRGYRVLEQTF
ncbi:hypothetical protein H9L15_03575 [Sphingomonas daechungensis]|uniref:Uncharacterized protein n=2 Tax=Sphingomonas daechungensis TaxID=1176646 RepID=A0ABX6T4B2_9SPHN|nr:hypothetical protein H9L15_03575 [Sphingomonas daechungensis]